MAYKFGLSGGETLDHNLSFKKNIDELFHSSKIVNFVGWRPDTGFDVFLNNENFEKINVIEIFSPNAQYLSRQNIPKVFVYNKDVKDVLEFLPETDFDCLVWQDGPEHLRMSESISLLNALKTKFKKIIIATPKGEFPQGALFGNPAEEHLSSWEIKDYESIGFTCSVIGENFLIGYWKND
jgi:hypothetical protein